MSEDWQRVVLDDADPHDRVGAVTVSELRLAVVEDLRLRLGAAVDEMLDELKIMDVRRRKLVHAQALFRLNGFALTLIDAGAAKLQLRLQGRAPSH